MTLETILQRIGAYVDQDSTTPTGTDLTVRMSYVNQAYDEWANSYEWRSLKRSYGLMASEALSTISLPSDFSRLESPLMNWGDDGRIIPEEYELVEMADRRSYTTSDKYCYIEGNAASGYFMRLTKPIEAGSSVIFDYTIKPVELGSVGQTPLIDDPQFLVQRGIAYVLEARGDSRFPQAKADAEKLLGRMVENENAKYSGAKENTVRNYYKGIASKFRIGRG